MEERKTGTEVARKVVWMELTNHFQIGVGVARANRGMIDIIKALVKLVL